MATQKVQIDVVGPVRQTSEFDGKVSQLVCRTQWHRKHGSEIQR
jgi:hypothetical protein